MLKTAQFHQKLLFETAPPVQKFPKDPAPYTPFGTQADHVLGPSFRNLGSQNREKVDKCSYS